MREHAPVTGVPSVRTQRLLLRAWQSSDREPFARMNADPMVMRHFPTLLSAAESDASVDRMESHWRERGYGLWAVERIDTGEFIGFIGLSTVSFDAAFTPAVEVGWRLAGAHWGQGFATEGGRAALDFGFTRLGLAEVVSFTAVGNVKSVAVMQRLGLAPEPSLDFEHPAVPVGHPARPHVFYRISRPCWRNAAASSV